MASSVSVVRRTMFGGRLGAQKRSTFYLEFFLPRVYGFAESHAPLYPRAMSSLQATSIFDEGHSYAVSADAVETATFFLPCGKGHSAHSLNAS